MVFSINRLRYDRLPLQARAAAVINFGGRKSYQDYQRRDTTYAKQYRKQWVAL